MAKAEGMTLEFVGPEHINHQILETFPYQGPKQRVVYTTTEFSAVCPFSGLPDLAKVVVDYIPAKAIVELKSLKYYYLSYRNVGIYQEHATSLIYEHLWDALKPTELTVTVTYQTRGGIDTTSSVNSLNQ